LLCQECPPRPFCSQLCPDAQLYADQDKTRQREISTPTPRYGLIPEGIEQIPRITNKKPQILALLRGGLSPGEVCELLRMTRKKLRGHLTLMKG
jgi:hypothetical protein